MASSSMSGLSVCASRTVNSVPWRVSSPRACSQRPQRRFSQRARRAEALGGRQQQQPAPASEDDEGPSTSGRSHWDALVAGVPAGAAAAAMLLLLPAGAAHAHGGEAAPGLLEFVITFIEGLGPWGPAAFVATVALAECIPLFPTQPLSLASGLLFGAQKGSLCMLSGTVLAALLAFQIARGIGRPLAERIIHHEMGGGGGSGGEAGEPGPVARKLSEVTEAIERGSFWQQAGAVLLLRMTPVVPFSASNYVLGLSPLPLPPYLAGTTVAMAFWSLFYASLGGASRSLLRRGVDPDVLLADLMDKAGLYTRELAVGGVVLGGGALVYLGVRLARRQLAAGATSGDAVGPAAAGQEAAGEEAEGSTSTSNNIIISSNGASSNGSGGASSNVSGGAALRAEAAQLAHELRRSAAAGPPALPVARELELASLRLKGWLGSGAAAPPVARTEEQQLVDSTLKD